MHPKKRPSGDFQTASGSRRTMASSGSRRALKSSRSRRPMKSSGSRRASRATASGLAYSASRSSAVHPHRHRAESSNAGRAVLIIAGCSLAAIVGVAAYGFRSQPPAVPVRPVAPAHTVSPTATVPAEPKPGASAIAAPESESPARKRGGREVEAIADQLAERNRAQTEELRIRLQQMSVTPKPGNLSQSAIAPADAPAGGPILDVRVDIITNNAIAIDALPRPSAPTLVADDAALPAPDEPSLPDEEEKEKLEKRAADSSQPNAPHPTPPAPPAEPGLDDLPLPD